MTSYVKMGVRVTHAGEILMAEFTLDGVVYKVLGKTVDELEKQIVGAVKTAIGDAIIQVRYTIITDQIITTLEEG